MEDRKESFLRGALALTIAQVVSRFIGLFYKIILVRILGPFAWGLANYAYPAYALMLALSTQGINVAISRIIADRVARGRYDAAWRAFRLGNIMMGSLGLFFTLVLILGARTLSSFQNPLAFYSYIALAPAIFLVAVMSSFRGFFQGLQQMTPNAVSQIIEQILRVALAIVLAIVLVPKVLQFTGDVDVSKLIPWKQMESASEQNRLAIAAAGTNLGAVVGAAGGLIYLLYVFWKQRPTFLARMKHQTENPPEPASRVFNEILTLAVPISLAGAVLPLMQQVDSFLVPIRLKTAGIEGVAATEWYGRLVNAIALVNMPTIVSYALFVSLVPAIAEAMAKGNHALVKARAAAGYRLTLLLAIPSMVGLALLPREISHLTVSDAETGIPLLFLAPVALFVALQQTSSGILQGLGKSTLPVKNLMFGALGKIVFTWILAGIPVLNIRGAAIGSSIAFFIAGALNIVSVTKALGDSLGVLGMMVKPGIASAVMAVAVKLSFAGLVTVTGSQGLSTLGAVGIGAGVYGLVLLAIGGLVARDFDMIPRVGPKLAAILKNLGLLRG